MHAVDVLEHTLSKGGSFCALLRHGAASPNNVSENRHKGCTCSAWAVGALPARRD